MCLSFLVWAVCLAHAIKGNPHQTPGAVPQAGHLPFWALLPDEILRLLHLIHEEASLQGRRGNLLGCQSVLQFRARSAASLSSWLCLRQGWLRCPISLACVVSHRLAPGWDAPRYGDFSSHCQKSHSSASLSPSEKQFWLCRWAIWRGGALKPQTLVFFLQSVPSRDTQSLSLVTPASCNFCRWR